ncbi:MAG: hypothetical protein H0V44_10745 [Planctomycetes bacterium]|nr:hypothetical protein [Planctomycetota bacterium]
MPRDAKPGTYTGTIIVDGGGSRESIPVSVLVLPVALPPVPIPMGLFLNALPFDKRYVDEATWWRLQESLLAEQGNAGLNAPTGGTGLELSFTDDGSAIVGDDALRYLELAKRYGMDRAVGAYGGFLSAPRGEVATRAAQTLQAFEAQHHLPPLYVNIYDEPNHHEERVAAIARLKPLTDAGLRTTGYTSAHWDDPEWVEVVANSYAPAFNVHDRGLFARVKAMGKHPWIYNNPRDRFGYSVDLWRQIRLGCEGRLDWIGNYVQGFAFSNLDGREPSTAFFAIHRDLGVLRTPRWLAAREGLLDLRLRLALESVAPAGDAALEHWTTDAYRTDTARWTPAELDRVRAVMLKRLQELRPR